MPMYKWKCAVCSQEVEVLRSISEYEQEPSNSEVSDDDCDEHVWERQMQFTTVVKGDNWGPGKGYY